MTVAVLRSLWISQETLVANLKQAFQALFLSSSIRILRQITPSDEGWQNGIACAGLNKPDSRL